VRRSVSITVSAPAEKIYDFVSDVRRLGRLSPECHACEWTDIDGPRAGAVFLGHNRNAQMEWTTVCQVCVAAPGREFGFDAGSADEKWTRWHYELTPVAHETVVTESFEVLTLAPPLIGLSDAELERRFDALEAGMRDTLAALKEAVEAGAGSEC
jgi:hypothetical protein